MKIFVDSTDVTEIKRLVDTGLIDGVTTNPTLVKKSGRSILELIEQICGIIDGPVSAEVTSTESERMLSEGLILASIAPNVVVKVPVTPDGLKVCRRLRDEDHKVNVTLCFSPLQALLAAKAGATFISPFVGRLDDIGHEGMALISDICTIYRNYQFTTEVLVASVRHPDHVVKAAQLGADAVTIPSSLLDQFFHHPLTDIGLAKFMEDCRDQSIENDPYRLMLRST